MPQKYRKYDNRNYINSLQRKALIQEIDDEDFDGILDIRREMSNSIEAEAIIQVSKPVAILLNEIIDKFNDDPRFKGK